LFLKNRERNCDVFKRGKMFDVVEVATFVISFVAFLFILVGYSNCEPKSDIKKILRLLFIFSVFILLNRIFTNMENVAFGTILNLLEHLSILTASVVLLIFVLTAKKNLSVGEGSKWK